MHPIRVGTGPYATRQDVIRYHFSTDPRLGEKVFQKRVSSLGCIKEGVVLMQAGGVARISCPSGGGTYWIELLEIVKQ